MALFGFLKKSRYGLPLPPPLSPSDAPSIVGDIETIRGMDEEMEVEEHEEMLPELPLALPAPKINAIVFDKTISEPSEETIRPVIKPAFVAVEDYKQIVSDTNVIRSKLMNAESYVRKLSELKSQEENVFEKWRSHLEGCEKKLEYVDRLVAKAER